MAIQRKKRSTGNMSMEVQRELGAINEALKNAESHRTEVIRRMDQQGEKTDRLSESILDVRGSIKNMEQTLSSTSSILNAVAMEKCGDRLDKLEEKCRNLPLIESEIQFWKRVLGGGAHALWKIGGMLIASGLLGALITKYVIPHLS